MAKDAELDRLKAAQDAAFQRKQRAYDAQDAAWKRRTAASDAMNRAFEEKQQAYDTQRDTWESAQRVREQNGPQIDKLNAQQEAAFQNMKRAYENASAAYERRDGASAKSYAEEGRRYKEESQRYVDERRRLVADIRTAKARLDAIKPTFQRAKDSYDSARRMFDSAKEDHAKTQTEFKAAKADFDQAARAFQARLNIVRSVTTRRNDEKRSLAEKAGVPHQYRDKLWVSTDADGNTNIYFGGVDKPNGPGHGHYVMDTSGKVTYKREPFDPHGSQNFSENRREGITLAMARRAMDQWAKTHTTPWATQHEDSDFKVQAKSGYDRQRDCIVTDVLIYDKQNKREHYHLVINEQGQELFAEWRPNRT